MVERSVRIARFFAIVSAIVTFVGVSPRTLQAAATVDYSQGGYADRTSVPQGGSITFHIATSVSPFDLKIVNELDDTHPVATLRQLTSQPQDCTGRYETGCGWVDTTTFSVPADWPSGYYAAKFPTSAGEKNIIFVVSPAQPGSTSPIVLVSTTNTYNSYNGFGGKSAYDSNSSDHKHAFQVSYDRPYDDNDGLGRFPMWEKPFILWMQKEHHTFEVVTDPDLEDPNLLGHYKLVLLVGHSEYWRAEARQQLEQFSRAGHHVVIFGGNTMWWQIRYQDNTRTQIIYKDATKDPDLGKDDAHLTINWFQEPVFNPENLITGASFRNGGYVNKVADADVYESVPVEKRVGYTVVDTNNWLLQSANVKPGDTFGKAAAGLEVDGALYNCDNTRRAATLAGSDGTPPNYHILATVPGSNGHGTIGYYVNEAGGMVFNAGTRDWANALATDRVIDLITTRLLDRLSKGDPLPYDEVKTPLITQELFNCPADSSTPLAGWRGTTGKATLSPQCAKEGPTGLEMNSQDDIELARNLTPTGVPLQQIYMQAYLDADKFNANSAPDVFSLFTLQMRKNGKNQRLAQLQLRASPPSIRLQQLQDNKPGDKSAWVPLGKGWQLTGLDWAAPGSVTLSINRTAVHPLDNPNPQGMNEIVLSMPKVDKPSNGYLCVDAIAVSSQAINPVTAGK